VNATEKWNLVVNVLTSAGTLAAAFLAWRTVKQSHDEAKSRSEADKIAIQTDLIREASSRWENGGSGDDYLFAAYCVMRDYQWSDQEWDQLQDLARQMSKWMTTDLASPKDKLSARIERYHLEALKK
jgi:hypothetical protein